MTIHPEIEKMVKNTCTLKACSFPKCKGACFACVDAEQRAQAAWACALDCLIAELRSGPENYFNVSGLETKRKELGL